MKIVVFGAGGYIGIPLCEELHRAGHDVIACDRWYFGKFPNIRRPSFREDIRDPQVFKHENKIDAVIDLSGLSNDACAEIDPELTKQINNHGGKGLANAAKNAGVKRYIYSSSASVYGFGKDHHLSEFDSVNPLTEYAKSKVAVEAHLREITKDGFDTVILRNATVFGVAPRMRFDLAVNAMAMRACKEKTIYVMGGGHQYRPFIHITDLVNVFVKMLEAPSFQVAGRTFNVGSDVLNYTINQIAGIVRQEFRDAKIHQIPDSPDNRSYHLSFKALRDFGFECRHSIEYGVKELRAALESEQISGDDPTTITLAWYKQMIEWERRLEDIRLNGKIL